jgi:hypothetical protein
LQQHLRTLEVCKQSTFAVSIVCGLLSFLHAPQKSKAKTASGAQKPVAVDQQSGKGSETKLVGSRSYKEMKAAVPVF